MKKLIIYVWAILCSVNLFSQDEKPLQYKLIGTSELIGITALDLLDPYLSPLMYTGTGVKYEHAARNFFRHKNEFVDGKKNFRFSRNHRQPCKHFIYELFWGKLQLGNALSFQDFT